MPCTGLKNDFSEGTQACSMNEFALIRRYFSGWDRGPGVALGVGDDAALLAPTAGQHLVLSVDTLVCGTHFLPSQPAAAIGHKALAAAASDLAAMGAEPLGFLLALTLPRADPDWLQAFAQGMACLAQRLGLPLVGGDTTRGPLAISVTVLGQAPQGQALLRSGARPGDLLVVSGALGGANAGLRIFSDRSISTDLRDAPSGPQLATRSQDPSDDVVAPNVGAEAMNSPFRRLLWPEPRIALGLALRGHAHAAIDISDGLCADVGHLCAASGCGVRIEGDRVPCDPLLARWGESEAITAALTGGEDYELAWAWPHTERAGLENLARALDLPLTVIGEFIPGEGVQVVDSDGSPFPVAAAGGYDHFAENANVADNASFNAAMNDVSLNGATCNASLNSAIGAEPDNTPGEKNWDLRVRLSGAVSAEPTNAPSKE